MTIYKPCMSDSIEVMPLQFTRNLIVRLTTMQILTRTPKHFYTNKQSYPNGLRSSPLLTANRQREEKPNGWQYLLLLLHQESSRAITDN